MVEFKRVDRQQVHTISAYAGSALTLNVGDLIAYNVSSGEVSKITSLADAKGAKDDGMELYIVAQSDDVTYNKGTAYKTYKVGKTVVVSTSSAAKSLIAGYEVKNLDNIIL